MDILNRVYNQNILLYKLYNNVNLRKIRKIDD